MLKKLSILVVLLLSCFVVQARERSDSTSFLQRMDEKMYRRQHKTGTDTTYIQIPEQRWTFKTSSNLTWNTLGVKHVSDGEGYSTAMRSALSYSQGFSVAWRWLGISASINPAWFFPALKNKDQSYTISVYNNKFCMSAGIRYANSYSGTMKTIPDTTRITIPRGDVTSDLTAEFDGYFIFNGDKFSFPAAFTMTQIQKRSAGSAILSFSLRNGITKFEGISYNAPEQMKLWTNMFAFGGGYAHNFVTPHNWLLHASATVNLALLSYNKLYTPSGNYVMKITFPDWVGTFQFSALHWTGKWFYGATVAVRGAVYGTSDRLEFANARTEGHIVVGLRL